MRRRLLAALLTLGVSLWMFSAIASAEDVYVTKKGKRYHKKESRFIKGKEVQTMSREEAEALGYKPSSEFTDAATDNPSEVSK